MGNEEMATAETTADAEDTVMPTATRGSSSSGGKKSASSGKRGGKKGSSSGKKSGSSGSGTSFAQNK